MRTPQDRAAGTGSGTGWPDEPGSPAAGSARRAPSAGAWWSLRRRALACAAGLAAVTTLGLALRGGALPGPDLWLHDAVVRHRDGLLVVARGITEGGSTWLVWPLIALAAVTFPRTRGPRAWLVSLAVGALVGLGVSARLAASLAVHRARPPREDWAMHAGGYAFPSGHTTAATLAAGFLAWAVTRHVADRRGRVAVWVLAAGYAGGVGWSRVWLGVHWPLDVLGGWLLGAAWVTGTAVVVAAVSRRRPGWVDG